MRVRAESSLREIVNGIRYGYPLCCVLTYAFDPRAIGGRRRGVIDVGVRANGESKRWVPCRLHQHHSCWRDHEADMCHLAAVPGRR